MHFRLLLKAWAAAAPQVKSRFIACFAVKRVSLMIPTTGSRLIWPHATSSSRSAGMVKASRCAFQTSVRFPLSAPYVVENRCWRSAEMGCAMASKLLLQLRKQCGHIGR